MSEQNKPTTKPAGQQIIEGLRKYNAEHGRPAVSTENKPAGEIAGRIMAIDITPVKWWAERFLNTEERRNIYHSGSYHTLGKAATIAAEHEAKLRARIEELEMELDDALSKMEAALDPTDAILKDLSSADGSFRATVQTRLTKAFVGCFASMLKDNPVDGKPASVVSIEVFHPEFGPMMLSLRRGTESPESVATRHRAERDAATARIADLERELKYYHDLYDRESTIVARIWQQIGSPSYKDVNGRDIHDLIDELKADNARLREACEELERSEIRARSENGGGE